MGMKNLERTGVRERIKMILEGEERMRENMNRKDENARVSSHFEIAPFCWSVRMSSKYGDFIRPSVLFFFFIGCVGSSLLRGGYSSLRCTGFSLWWFLLLHSMGSRHRGFSSCGSQAQ